MKKTKAKKVTKKAKATTAKKAPRKYSRQWFINFFSHIPDKKWTTGTFLNAQGQSCAIGQIREHINDLDERMKARSALDKLLSSHSAIFINDNFNATFGHLGTTPKARILAALRYPKRIAPKKAA